LDILKTMRELFLRTTTPSPSSSIQPELIHFFSSIISKGDLCYDIGGNLGAKSDIFLSLGATVICVEPQPECVKVLRKKYRFNANVTIVAKGVSDKTGTQRLALCTQAPTIATFSDKWKTGRFKDYHWDDVITIPMTTLDLLISEYGLPRYCKIDVEGYELQVLKGLSKPISLISFEFTREFKDDIKRITEHLTSITQYEYNYCLGEEPGFRLAQWANPTDLLNSLSSIPDPLLWGDIYARVPLK
jgi:FkbM family methyltransferase